MNAAENGTRRTDLRAFGLKLIVVCGLALAMTIPAFFVEGLTTERSERAAEVAKEISAHVGGAQSFLGPVLAVPYRAASGSLAGLASNAVYLLFPAQARAEMNMATTERHRSLFRVPVFVADLKLESDFELNPSVIAVPAGMELDWTRAEVVVAASDLRGALIDPTLEQNGRVDTLGRSEMADLLTSQGNGKAPFRGAILAAKLAERTAPSSLHLVARMKFSGAERVAILAYGKTTHVVAQGDWRNPGFDGAILPSNRSVNDKGFHAEWTIPFTARGVGGWGPPDTLSALASTAVGLSFIEVGDPYQSVTRSLKYALLVIGLVFLCYFGFEVTTTKRVHPAQYILVGLAQIIFYLLLLSISERIGFDLGFLFAAAATVGLLSINAGWIFESRGRALQSFGMFTALYSLIFLLLRMEDNSLLIGSVASFGAIALLMYLTRRVDWYGSPAAATTSQS